MISWQSATVRADRLLSLLLLLQHRGRLTAGQLAAELEVSERTVLRDIEALSSAGVPVYAERGRAGGFRLLPGFRTDLTGLTVDEARSLLSAGSGRISSPAFTSAMRKLAAALPESQRAEVRRATARILVRTEGFLRDAPSEAHLAELQHAVFAGVRVRVRHTPFGGRARRRTVDPVGLVNAGGHWYLLALRDGLDRVYRVSRIDEVVLTDEPARRPDEVDLEALWAARRDEFRAGLPTTSVVVRARPDQLPALRRAAAVGATEQDGAHLRVELHFGDLEHAEHVLWRLRADVVEPPELRARLHAAARELLG